MPVTLPQITGWPTYQPPDLVSIYDPLAGIKKAEELNKLQSQNILNNIDAIKLKDLQRESGISEQLLGVGKELLNQPSGGNALAPVTPPAGPAQQPPGSPTSSGFGPMGFQTSPGAIPLTGPSGNVTTNPFVQPSMGQVPQYGQPNGTVAPWPSRPQAPAPTPGGPAPQAPGTPQGGPKMVKLSSGESFPEETIKRYPEYFARKEMMARDAIQQQQKQEYVDKRKDALRRIDEIIEKGSQESFDAYRNFLYKDPATADIAKQAEGIKVLGGNAYEGQKYFSSEDLKRIDPDQKLTNGTPGIYDITGKGQRIEKMKKIKPDREMLVNSATNGTPQEQAWAKSVLLGQQEFESPNPYRDFRSGEISKVRKEHPDWDVSRVEGEVQRRWKDEEEARQLRLVRGRLEEQKKQWSPEAQKIADAIMRGEQPPDLSGWGMRNVAPEARSIMADKHYDLSAAMLDWTAYKKWIQTVNGAQQVRLQQATRFAFESLDIIEGLAKKWDAGPYPILNKANILLAKQGAFGTEAAKIATQLDTQVADLTSELGTVYKGGNSSTDESLKLAAKNLSTDWSRDVLMGNVDLTRQNLQIRLNTMKHTGPAGIQSSAKDMDAITKEYELKREKRLGIEAPPTSKKPSKETKTEPRKPGESIAEYLKRIGKK